MKKHTTLKQIFGYDSFRPGQEELINKLLSSQDVLGIMPTGAGKSICYQIPALLMKGITLVISPLISLMKDQVNALTQAGVAAAFLNSSLSPQQYEKAISNAEQGRYKIIYVAPERLTTQRFRSFLQCVELSAVIVDEAHCISHWGHDFRPSYLNINEFLSSLEKRPVVGAFTATATQEVRTDIITLLELQSPHVLVAGFDRNNLFFKTNTPADKDRELLRLILERSGKSGIVYCSTRGNVEAVCELLIQNGISATRYHAGLELEERQQNQNDFVHDTKKVMIASNAFGMGIDKSNVSFVIHYNMPKNVESYYQEAGRAGRDGEPADCVLLYAPKDVQINRFLIENSQDVNEDISFEELEILRQNNMELLKLMTFYATTTECLRRYILRYFGEDAPVYCGNCSNCNQYYETVDITVDTQKIISCVTRIARMGRSAGKKTIAGVLHGERNEKILQNGYDMLPTFGIMTDTPVRRIVYTIEFLISQDYLTLSDGKYPVLGITAKSAAGLSGESVIVMNLPQEKETSRTKREKKADVMSVDIILFEKLASLRLSLARESGVPAYVVFSDATLREMCQQMPVTENRFLKITGVGLTKLEKYGDAFMQVIRSYKEAP